MEAFVSQKAIESFDLNKYLAERDACTELDLNLHMEVADCGTCYPTTQSPLNFAPRAVYIKDPTTPGILVDVGSAAPGADAEIQCWGLGGTSNPRTTVHGAVEAFGWPSIGGVDQAVVMGTLLAQAMGSWNAGYTRFDMATSQYPAKFVVKYGGNKEGTRATAFYPGEGDSNTLWVYDELLYRSPASYFIGTMEHELGHVRGLRHPRGPDYPGEPPAYQISAMDPLSVMGRQNPSGVPIRRLQQSDRDAENELTSLGVEAWVNAEFGGMLTYRKDGPTGITFRVVPHYAWVAGHAPPPR
ncbi:hypothetical protein COCOBI_02-0220 [Coccomyxa sp. Obi]|nr:hypothetical protein COCOBI_02-0220 [Coccomyxa sp. Obi]